MHRDHNDFSTLVKYLPMEVIRHYKKKHIKHKQSQGSSNSSPLAPQFSATAQRVGAKIPDMQRCDCVSMFLDVAKFTVLTAELARYRDGAGQLATALNNLMQCIARKVRSSNGDILKFAGDALVIVWPIAYHSDDPNEQSYEESNLQHQIHTALSVAWGLMQRLEFNSFVVVDPNVTVVEQQAIAAAQQKQNAKSSLNDVKELAIKVGISYGKMTILHLGGVADTIVKSRYEYLGVGPALDEAFHSEGKCEPSQVVITKKVKELPVVEENYNTQPVMAPSKVLKHEPNSRLFRTRQRYAELTTSKKSRVPNSKKQRKPSNKINKNLGLTIFRNRAKSASESNQGSDSPHYLLVGEKKNIVVKKYIYKNTEDIAAIGKLLWNYVPVAIVPYFSERSFEYWLPEMRTVTTMFCTLNVNHLLIKELYEDDALFENTPEAKDRAQHIVNILQNVFKTIQEVVFRYHGTINKFLLDDKGCSVLIVFGLPPFAHENDGDRAILCGFGIMGKLARSGVNGHIGITTGRAYCGAIGHISTRMEYTVIGDPVNVAARLMVAAKQRDMFIIIDNPTRLSLREPISCEIVPGLDLKGKGLYLAFEVSYHHLHSERLELRNSATEIEPDFQLQDNLAAAEKVILNGVTGVDIHAKFQKMHIDDPLEAKVFRHRLHRQNIPLESAIIQYEENKTITVEFGTLESPVETIGDLKRFVIAQLKEQRWSGLTQPVVNMNDSQERSVSEIDVYDQYTLSWRRKLGDIVSESMHEIRMKELNYVPLNDFFNIRRFHVAESVIELKLTKSTMNVWRIKDRMLSAVNEKHKRNLLSKKNKKLGQNSTFFSFDAGVVADNHFASLDLHSQARLREDSEGSLYRENCFSLRDRLEIIANEFYTPFFVARKSSDNEDPPAKSRSSMHRMQVVLVEAGQGIGKTFAVNELISTIFKTSSFEVVLAGGDPYETGADIAPFALFKTIVNQVFNLRRDLRSSQNTIYRKRNEKVHQDFSAEELIRFALEKAQAVFERCSIPTEAESEAEKNNHRFNKNNLYLLNEFLGTKFSHPSKLAAPDGNRGVALTLSDSMEKTMTQILDNNLKFSVGRGFEGNRAKHMSLNVRKRLTLDRKMVSRIQRVRNTRRPKTSIAALTDDSESLASEDRQRSASRAYKKSSRLAQDLQVPRTSFKSYDDSLDPLFDDEWESGDERIDAVLGPDPVVVEDKYVENTDSAAIDTLEETVKLFAAIIVGLSNSGVPILIGIDNCQHADPYSLLVVQELVQWWDAADLFLLLSVRKAFSAEIGLSNVRNYAVEAGKRMSIIAPDLLDITTTFLQSSAEKEYSSKSAILIEQLKDLTRTKKIEVYADKRFTEHIIHASIQRLYPDCSFGHQMVQVKKNLKSFLIDRAAGNFLHVTEAINLYKCNELVELVKNELVPTKLGEELLTKALYLLNGQTSSERPEKRKRQLSKRTKGSFFQIKNPLSQRVPVEGTKSSTVDDITTLIPASVRGNFDEYFDSLPLKEQLLLKCAALVASKSAVSHRRTFTFTQVQQICPFFQGKARHHRVEKDIQERFDVLQKTGLIVSHNRSLDVTGVARKDKKFEFRSEWLVDILTARLLSEQTRRLAKRLKAVKEEKVNQDHKEMIKVLETKVELTEMRGILYIKKSKGNRGYKKRFCVLTKGEITFYREDPDRAGDTRWKENKRTVLKLGTRGANIRHFDGRLPKTSLSMYNLSEENAFIIETGEHESTKAGKTNKNFKRFLCVAPCQEEFSYWLNRIKFQIRLAKLQDSGLSHVSL